MNYSETRFGRVFVLRLENGEILHERLEAFAVEKGINAAMVTIVGGVDAGSRLVVGPLEPNAIPIIPMETILDAPCEATGTGTIFPDDTGAPLLHMHIACGRHTSTTTGCVRRGVKVWLVLEVVLAEMLDCDASRALDLGSGFKLLRCGTAII